MKKIILVLLASSVLGIVLAIFSLASDIPSGSVNSDETNGNQEKIENMDDLVEIILTGDVMLGRSVMIKSLDLKDPIYPFRKVGNRLKNADLVLINLENPIIENCPRIEGGFKFCSLPSMVQGLVFAGIDIASLANNHAGNYGEEGIKETIEVLGKNGISAVGNGISIIREYEGINFGFLGFDSTLKTLTDKDLELIKNTNEVVDILIVSVHWGEEYTSEPTKYQKKWAEAMVNAGADVIVGHHPHWVQSIDYIKQKPVYYSLGNFIFDQMWSENTKKGLLVGLTFDNGKNLIKEERIPTYMSSWAQPSFIADDSENTGNP